MECLVQGLQLLLESCQDTAVFTFDPSRNAARPPKLTAFPFVPRGWHRRRRQQQQLLLAQPATGKSSATRKKGKGHQVPPSSSVADSTQTGAVIDKADSSNAAAAEAPCMLPYPFLLVNIGSGTSIVKVLGPRDAVLIPLDADAAASEEEATTSSLPHPPSFVRVGGSPIGGGTFWGLTRALTKIRSWDDLKEVTRLDGPGDNTRVDLLVGDIYGYNHRATQASSLPANLTSETLASCFGKLGTSSSRPPRIVVSSAVPPPPPQPVSLAAAAGSPQLPLTTGDGAGSSGGGGGPLDRSEMPMSPVNMAAVSSAVDFGSLVLGGGTGDDSSASGAYRGEGARPADDDDDDILEITDESGPERQRRLESMAEMSERIRRMGASANFAATTTAQQGDLADRISALSPGEARDHTLPDRVEPQTREESWHRIPTPASGHPPHHHHGRQLSTGSASSFESSMVRRASSFRNIAGGAPQRIHSPTPHVLPPPLIRNGGAGGGAASDFPSDPASAAAVAAAAAAAADAQQQQQQVDAPTNVDMVRSLLLMVATNVTQIAYLHAKSEKITNILFTGGFVRGNALVWAQITRALEYWSGGTATAHFLRMDGYVGVIGAMLNSDDVSSQQVPDAAAPATAATAPAPQKLIATNVVDEGSVEAKEE
jgi:pantothenate kinase